MNNETTKGLVSVGLPVYNRPDSLRRVLNIATTQTYTNIEIVVSDNASPDTRVSEIIEEFARRDSRIKFYKQDKNKGVLANAEFVLKKSQGEYFTWFSDDDWRSPEFIEILVAELEINKDVNLAFCDYHEVYENGNLADGYPSTHLNFFKPFESRYRLIRIMCFYWQNAVRGKSNIFYSVFRRAAFDGLDLKKLSGAYRHLNMDCLIVFTLLQKGPVSIRSEAMCTLTCGNKKYYSIDERQSKQSGRTILSKLINFTIDQKEDRNLYVANTDFFVEKMIIYLLFFPKLLVLLTAISFKKIMASNTIQDGDSYGIELDKSPSNANVHSSEKIKLKNVTLVAVATRNVEETLKALVYSCRGIEFGSVKLLSHYTPYGFDKNIEFIRIEKIKSIDDWSYKIIYDLNQYIDTNFALLVHADGFVVNPSSWKDEFLSYDYIGAPWPLPTDNFSYRDINGNIIRVGNSVSLRSKRLLELPIKLNLPWEPYCGYLNEDGFICTKNRHIYEAAGMKFAPLDVAKYFSHESMIPEVKNIKPFAFHKWAGSNCAYPRF